VVLLTLAAALQRPAFAQKKTPDPETRNKRAVSVEPQKSGSGATSPVKGNAATARDLAKIEQSGKANTTHKAKSSSTTVAAKIPPEPQPKSKPIKFSHHAPKASGNSPPTTPVAPNTAAKVRH
jgi:hypothetical protein